MRSFENIKEFVLEQNGKFYLSTAGSVAGCVLAATYGVPLAVYATGYSVNAGMGFLGYGWMNSMAASVHAGAAVYNYGFWPVTALGSTVGAGAGNMLGRGVEKAGVLVSDSAKSLFRFFNKPDGVLAIHPAAIAVEGLSVQGCDVKNIHPAFICSRVSLTDIHPAALGGDRKVSDIASSKDFNADNVHPASL